MIYLSILRRSLSKIFCLVFYVDAIHLISLALKSLCVIVICPLCAIQRWLESIWTFFFSLFIFMNLDVNSWHRTRSHFHPSFWRLSLIYLLFLLCASEWRKWSEAVAVAVLGMILVCPKFDNNFGLLMCSGLLRERERKRVCIICWIVRYLLYVHFRCPLFWWNWTEEAIHKTQNVCGHYTVWAWIYFQLFGHKHTRK